MQKCQKQKLQWVSNKKLTNKPNKNIQKILPGNKIMATTPLTITNPVIFLLQLPIVYLIIPFPINLPISAKTNKIDTVTKNKVMFINKIIFFVFGEHITNLLCGKW